MLFFVIIYDYFHCPFIKSRPLTNFFNVTNYMILAWAAVVAMTRQKYYLNRTTQYNTYTDTHQIAGQRKQHYIVFIQ